MQKKVNQVR